jgi:pyruvate dehydrogenase E1 component beta subunit
VATLTYARAVALGLQEAMDEDERVFCLGEDVGYGGAYGATQGLRDRFGSERVRDTPISEIAIVGFSVGAAAAGWRPVPEIMHLDFATVAMDQIVNQAAKMRYMFGGKARLPMVIRCGTGGWLNAAAQHSQSLEAWFAHTPGLKVATAGTPSDIRSLLLAAIHDDNPVIVQEPLSLYEESSEVPDNPEPVRLGKASHKRNGDDVSIVTWGAMVPRVMGAAETLAREGIEADVIDLISIYPWDVDAVLESLARTHRMVVVHQATRRAGFGAEVAAEISERGFDLLDAPIARVAALNVPVPFAATLENYVLPSAERIVSAVRNLG